MNTKLGLAAMAAELKHVNYLDEKCIFLGKCNKKMDITMLI